MSFFKTFARRSTRSSKNKPNKLKVDEDDYVHLERYQGSYKDGRRHGKGVYYFNNGDIYDGEWRKGRKEGIGTYVFANGKKNVGWFYRDEYVGKEPNEELERKMRKKRTSPLDDAKPLQMENEASDLEYSSQSDDDEMTRGVCQEFLDNCKKVTEKVSRDKC
ncbi:radial spoke head 1 homolog [Actinia tenebrosa]|uniref:Radial spoke head 1 homolog n=1 Tax=Actinia tenebrosa TaxID=6105 RepID=A0A6P8J0H2_ACTTE|nr:radial spoke head 1 homolog [Actinia tenebrosa]